MDANLLQKEQMLMEIEKEKGLIEVFNASIDDLGQTTGKLESAVSRRLSYDDKGMRWKSKHEAQMRVNEHLESERRYLQQQLEIERSKMTNGWLNYPYLIELDENMTEFELQRLVRQLEMVKNGLINELRDTEWKVDHHSKQYFQLGDLCELYQSEIQAAQTDVIRLKQALAMDAHTSNQGTKISNPTTER